MRGATGARGVSERASADTVIASLRQHLSDHMTTRSDNTHRNATQTWNAARVAFDAPAPLGPMTACMPPPPLRRPAPAAAAAAPSPCTAAAAAGPCSADGLPATPLMPRRMCSLPPLARCVCVCVGGGGLHS